MNSGIRELVMANESKIDELIRAIELSAASNEKLANTTEKEIDAMKSEYKDLRAIIETQANSTAKSIKDLTNSMHEMSTSLQTFALKAQHNSTEHKTEIARVKTDLCETNTDIKHLEGQLLIVHQENNDRDMAVNLLSKDIDSINKSINSLHDKLDKKGKWWSDNWSKVITVSIVVGTVIWGIAITMAKIADKTGVL